MLSNLPSQIQKEMELIRPLVEERFAKMEEYGEDWDDQPVCQPIVFDIPLIYGTETQNDVLMGLMNKAKGVERSLGTLARRLLLANLVAVDTTSQASATSLTSTM